MRNRILVIDALSYKKNKAFGYQEYLFNLLNFFSHNRDKILYNEIIIACDKSQIDEFNNYAKVFVVKGFNISTIISRFFVLIFLPYILRLNKTDTILFTGNYSSLFKKSKQVLVIHDLLYLRKRLLHSFIIRLQRNLFVPRSVKLADMTIAISEFTKNDVLKNIRTSQRNRIIRIYNYFNFEKYLNTSDNYLNLLHTKYFLSISSDAYHKNLITILKAFAKYCIYNQNKDLCLVGKLSNVGALSYYNQLDIKIKKRIHVLSCISNKELSVLYNGCEAYISATLFEGLGMPIVEAMYFNVPLILSDIPICHEVANDKAVFFNPNSVPELFQILISFKSQKLDTRSFVMDRYSAVNTSQKYIDVLNLL